MSTRIYVDTSALAKLYLAEHASSQFRYFLRRQTSPTLISTLTMLELRCVLSRRRRAGEIDDVKERFFIADLEKRVRRGIVIVYPLDDSHVRHAIDLLAAMPAHHLRTLDALHLAIARGLRADIIATADRKLEKAADALGFSVETFA